MGMKQPNSQNEFANKALQVTAHKAPNLNADVRIENMKIRLAADAA